MEVLVLQAGQQTLQPETGAHGGEGRRRHMWAPGARKIEERTELMRFTPTWIGSLDRKPRLKIAAWSLRAGR